MVNNYDKIARHYDKLSRLVFFKAQLNAQINQLSHIPQNSNVLIAGGGTGWILEELAKVHPAGLKIVYVEISAKMIALSKARNYRGNEVIFLNQGIETFTAKTAFDAVLTPFLFDNFSEKRASQVFEQLDSCLKPAALWFLVDFSLNTSKGKWWKLLLLKSMYRFFKLLGIVEASNLIDMHPYFLKRNYEVVEERFYYGDFIKGAIYKK